MRIQEANRTLLYLLISCLTLLFSSCDNEDEEPEPASDFVITDDAGINLYLTWTAPNNENGFEVADLDLAITDATTDSLNINTSESGNQFEDLRINTNTPDNTFNIRVRYYNPRNTDRETINYTLVISNNDSTVTRVFTNSITPPAIGTTTSWIDEDVQILTTIWKSGSNYTFIE